MAPRKNNAPRVHRYYAAYNDQDLLWEAYQKDGKHRARLSPAGAETSVAFTIGEGVTESDALFDAWEKWKVKYNIT